MRTKVFVGGLSWDTDEASLRAAFETIGPVEEATVITHRDGDHQGKSKGFGFVRYGTEDDASEAVSQMDGYNLDGRPIRVDWATEKQRDDRGNGNRRGGNGNRRRRN